MAEIKIGHASWSENQSAEGTPGETKDTEVIISTLTKKYHIVLRPKKTTLARASALACEAACKNSCIGYGQSDRNTLYAEAKKVNFDLSKITTPCNADCASFMSVCAIAGGSSMVYGYYNSSNAPSVPYIVEWFTASKDYEALTDSKLLNNPDYLKRGDILLIENDDGDSNPDHVAMVLSNGAKIPNSFKINVITKMIAKTKAEFSGKIFEIKYDTGDLIEKNDKWIKSCGLCYELEQLGDVSDTSKKSVNISNINNIVVSNLIPNNTYRLRIILTKETEKFYSSIIVFNTLQDYPAAVKNLKFTPTPTFCKDLLNNKLSIINDPGTLSFGVPSWGEYSSNRSSKGYYISLLLNGNKVAFEETSAVSNSTLIHLLSQVETFKLNDSIQFGIQTWIQDEHNNYIFDNKFFRSTKPVYLQLTQPMIDKIYVRTEDNHYNQGVLYNINYFNNDNGVL